MWFLEVDFLWIILHLHPIFNGVTYAMIEPPTVALAHARWQCDAFLLNPTRSVRQDRLSTPTGSKPPLT